MKDQIKKTLKAQGWKVKTAGDFVVATSKGEGGELWTSTVHAETLVSTVPKCSSFHSRRRCK
jgi:hypothetical protein